MKVGVSVSAARVTLAVMACAFPETGCALLKKNSAEDAASAPSRPPPAPRFFPRLTAEMMPEWMRPLRFGDMTLADARQVMPEIGSSPVRRAERNDLAWEANKAAAIVTYLGNAGPSGPSGVFYRFARLPNRTAPVLVGILAFQRTGVGRPALCTGFEPFRSASGANECPGGLYVPGLSTSFSRCGGDATGQMRMAVHCGSYSDRVGPMTLTFEQLRVELMVGSASAELPFPLPLLPQGFVEPSADASVAPAGDGGTTPATGTPGATDAGAPAAPPGPEEEGVSNLDGETWYCTSGRHEFRGLRLTGRRVAATDRCELTLTDCTLTGAPGDGVSVSGRARVTLNNCRVEPAAGKTGLSAHERGSLTVNGGQVIAGDNGVFTFDRARVTLTNTRVRGTHSALNASGSAQIVVRGSTIEGSSIVGERGKIKDGRGNTGLRVERY